jgi:hypothetical protein
VDKYTLDWYYTMHFPLTEKYISLYPKSEIENQKVSDKRDRIRQQLREEMLHGKKTVSGSNELDLGTRTPVREEVEESSSEMDDENEEQLEESEDEFLDLGHRQR